jgi:hypothetical protein
MVEAQAWRPCNMCKQSIRLGATYWVCSVSTCNRVRTKLHFCSVECWDAHLPDARHREAWAEEETAPASGQAANTATAHAATTPQRATADTGRTDAGKPPAPRPRSAPHPDEVLIVASRLKQFIRTQSGFSTSDRALSPLSDAVRTLCDEAIERARQAERSTVLGRDVPEEKDRGPAWLSR